MNIFISKLMDDIIMRNQESYILIGSLIVILGGAGFMISYAYAQADSVNAPKTYIIIFRNVNTTDGTPLAILSESKEELKSSLQNISDKAMINSTQMEKLNSAIEQGISKSLTLTAGSAFKYNITDVFLKPVTCTCTPDVCWWLLK